MLIDNPTLEGIVAGRIQVVFRTWQRPTVKTGGRLRTRMGVLAIEAVDAVTMAQVSAKDIKLAGYSSKDAWQHSLQDRVGTLYRIRVRHDGEDPRIALRQKPLTDDERALVSKRLQRMDSASTDGPWTQRYLTLIAERPAQRAPELAELMGLITKPFKQRVRKLKELGLTESLKVGYRLSPRGESYVHARKAAKRKASKTPKRKSS